MGQTEKELINELARLANEERAMASMRFFKTGPGQYGEGDKFIGVLQPDIRGVCKKFKTLPINELNKLVENPVHEHRMAALIIVAEQFKKADSNKQTQPYGFYLAALARGKINNWDLIDVTCPHVMGQYLKNKPKDILYELVKSRSLWERRASVLATFAFIQNGESEDAIKICKLLMNDKEDLIHKATGWMLREVGKRIDERILTDFLDQHSQEMPRTMLRYSIEKLTINQKQKYMSLK